MTYSLKNPLFPLGRLLVAPELEFLGVDIARLLRNHQTGDFGCVDQYDANQNLKAIDDNDDILSQYHIMAAEKNIMVCIMTVADRSYTVVFILDKTKLEFLENQDVNNNHDPECF
jgi:hypothetical protein